MQSCLEFRLPFCIFGKRNLTFYLKKGEKKKEKGILRAEGRVRVPVLTDTVNYYGSRLVPRLFGGNETK